MKKLFLLPFIFSLVIVVGTQSNIYSNATEISPILDQNIYQNDTGELFALSGQSVKVFLESNNIQEDFRGFLHCFVSNEAQDVNIEVFIKKESSDYIWCQVPILNESITKVSVFLTENPINADQGSVENHPSDTLNLFIHSDIDTDLDQIPNSVDTDDDGDEIPDQIEAEIGSNPLDIDTDDDGVQDFTEYQFGMNLNDSDSDNDELSDYDELFEYNTNPLTPDSDGDTIMDGREILVGGNPLKINTDDDCLNDPEELVEGTALNEPNIEFCEKLSTPDLTDSEDSIPDNDQEPPSNVITKIEKAIRVFRGSLKINPKKNPASKPIQKIYRGSLKVDPKKNFLDKPIQKTYRGSLKINPYTNILDENPLSGIYRGSKKINHEENPIAHFNFVPVETVSPPKEIISIPPSKEIDTKNTHKRFLLYVLGAIALVFIALYPRKKEKEKIEKQKK